MATIAEPQVVKDEQRLLLTDISWQFYQAFGEELRDRPIRLTYDRGRLEIMVTGRPHEWYRCMLGKLVDQTSIELDIPVSSGGSMTFQREDLKRGFEPDMCWWIAHEAEVRGRGELDFQHDPPPDLAIEVEITSSLVNRIGIYAALGVAEIWRYDGESLRFCLLQDDGAYHDAESSLAFPFLKPAHLTPFLRLDDNVDETSRVRQFVAWLRDQQSDS